MEGVNTLVTSKMAQSMGMEFTNLIIIHITKVTGTIISLTDKVSFYPLTANHIQESGKRTKCMGTGNLNIPIRDNTLVSFRMATSMAMEYSYGLTEKNTKDGGKIMPKTVKAS